MTPPSPPLVDNVSTESRKKPVWPWVVGCLVTSFVFLFVVGIVGLLAAIAIPSFVKARNASSQNSCINNMRQIDGAKEQWAMADDVNTGASCVTSKVNLYLRGAVTPTCHAGGAYLYHEIGEEPECTFHGPMSGTSASGY